MAQIKKLLIVDDNQVNRQVLRKILSESYEVLEAGNGRDALEILSACYDSISAVLLDIVMPVMDGYQVLEKIRGDAFLSKISIIVTTGSDDQDAEVKALSLGAHDFLVKPYKPAIILHRLANTINLRETAALVNAVEKDELTGVYNKEFFYKKAEQLLRENEDRSYDIVCLDIERFKLVNDLFGMHAGDALLRHIANLSLEHIGDKGICGRVGADKFAFLLPHREAYPDQLFQDTSEEINAFPINISINVCYGIYSVVDRTIPINVMCDRALIACSSIKGKYNVYCAYYTDEFRQSLLSEQTIGDSMKTALENREFEVYYQPKYDLSTETIAGAEALVRWNHPEKGFMSPAQFIPLFERNGFITDLDLYIWEMVCRQLRSWLDRGQPIVPISVNVSRADIYNPELARILMGLIQKYELSPEYLHLEITETAYTENPDQIISTVLELREQGFMIEMDDFGTGYSSLNMLSELPIHVLKLDMKFIQSETAKQNHKNILSFIISLAKWLNLQVVAEGVETAKQAQTLKSMDCNFAQGYYYARPMPEPDFIKLLLRHRARDASCAEQQKAPYHEQITIQNGLSDRVMVIVDDSELSRSALSDIFHDSYNIVEAANGEDGYHYIKENYTAIDIVLLDLVMPVMNGLQLLEKLKAEEHLQNIPVIITSQTGEDGEADALAKGAADFISKPYSREMALRRVSNVMAQSKLRAMESEHELVLKLEEMRYKAEHDYLTGLYNRIAIETIINTFFAHTEKPDSTFFMLDIDHFKLVNDTFGHDKGDKLLAQIAKTLSASFGEKDVVARLGGDEFGVFVPSVLPLPTLKKKAKELCKGLQIKLDGIEISATIGIASSPLYGSDYQTLYRHADCALLVAKRLGKNQYKIYDDQMEIPSPVLYRNMDWLLDETSDAIVICDTSSFEVLYLNSVAAKIAGKEKRLCIGRKCYETLWKRSSPCEHCVSCSKLSQSYVETEVDDTHSGRHYIIHEKLMEWGGTLARIQYIQDDTARNKVKHELLQANERASNMLACLQAGLVKYRPDDGWTVVEANDRFYELIGCSKEEFQEKFKNSLTALIGPHCQKADCGRLWEQLEKDNRAHMNTSFLGAEGQPIPISAQIVLVTESDGNSYFYATCIRTSQPRKSEI